VHGNGFAEAAS